MTDKVQKIRAELKRIMEACHDEIGNPITYGEDCAYARLCELKEYIDSLQEEPISIWHEPIERPDSNKVVLIIVRCGYIGDTGMPHLAKYDSHNNQYIDKDRTDVCNRPIMYHIDSVEKWVYIDDVLNLSNVERTIKNRKEEPVSEELEEAAIYYADTHTEWFDADNNPHVSPAFKAGAMWQKNKMMEDAIDAEACYTMGVPSIIISLPLNVKVGDKVKIVVVRSEEE